MSSKYEQIDGDGAPSHDNNEESKNTSSIRGIALQSLSRHRQPTSDRAAEPDETDINKNRALLNTRFSRFWIWELLLAKDKLHKDKEIKEKMFT